MFKNPYLGSKTHTLEQKGGMNKVADENVKEKLPKPRRRKSVPKASAAIKNTP